MKRQYFYFSINGLTQEDLQDELGEFLHELTVKYDNENFGATVLGISENAAKRIEKMLNE